MSVLKTKSAKAKPVKTEFVSKTPVDMRELLSFFAKMTDATLEVLARIENKLDARGNFGGYLSEIPGILKDSESSGAPAALKVQKTPEKFQEWRIMNEAVARVLENNSEKSWSVVLYIKNKHLASLDEILSRHGYERSGKIESRDEMRAPESRLELDFNPDSRLMTPVAVFHNRTGLVPGEKFFIDSDMPANKRHEAGGSESMLASLRIEVECECAYAHVDKCCGSQMIPDILLRRCKKEIFKTCAQFL
jgi:hypothetical protein